MSHHSATALAHTVMHKGMRHVPAPHESYEADGYTIHCWRGLPGGDVLCAEGIEAQVVDPGQSHMTVKGKTVHLPRRNPAIGDYFRAGKRAAAEGASTIAKAAKQAAASAQEAAEREAKSRKCDPPSVKEAVEILANAYGVGGVKKNPGHRQHDPTHKAYYEIRKFRGLHESGEPYKSYEADSQEEAASILRQFNPLDDVDVTRWSYQGGRWIGSPVTSHVWGHWESSVRQNPAPLTPTYLHTAEGWSLGYKGYRSNPRTNTIDSHQAIQAINDGDGSFTFERDSSNRVFLKLQGYGYIARIEIVNRDRHNPEGQLLVTPENAGVDAFQDSIVHALSKASLGAGWAAISKRHPELPPIEIVAMEMGTTLQVLSGKAGHSRRDVMQYAYRGLGYRSNPRINPRNAPLARKKVSPFGDIAVHPPQPKNDYWNIYVTGSNGTEAHYAWHEPNLLAEKGFWSERGRPPERLMHFCVELGLPEEARTAPVRGG